METVTIEKKTYDDMVETIRKAKDKESEIVNELQKKLDAVINKEGFTYFVGWGSTLKLFTSKEIHDIYAESIVSKEERITTLKCKINKIMSRNLFDRIFNKVI